MPNDHPKLCNNCRNFRAGWCDIFRATVKPAWLACARWSLTAHPTTRVKPKDLMGFIVIARTLEKYISVHWARRTKHVNEQTLPHLIGATSFSTDRRIIAIVPGRQLDAIELRYHMRHWEIQSPSFNLFTANPIVTFILQHNRLPSPDKALALSLDYLEKNLKNLRPHR